MVGDSNDETNFTHKLSLTDRKIWRYCKAFSNKSWTNRKLSKFQLSEIGQSGVLLCKI